MLIYFVHCVQPSKKRLITIWQSWYMKCDEPYVFFTPLIQDFGGPFFLKFLGVRPILLVKEFTKYVVKLVSFRGVLEYGNPLFLLAIPLS